MDVSREGGGGLKETFKGRFLQKNRFVSLSLILNRSVRCTSITPLWDNFLLNFFRVLNKVVRN